MNVSYTDISPRVTKVFRRSGSFFGQSLGRMWEEAKGFKCKPDDMLDAVCLAVTAALTGTWE